MISVKKKFYSEYFSEISERRTNLVHYEQENLSKYYQHVWT